MWSPKHRLNSRRFCSLVCQGMTSKKSWIDVQCDNCQSVFRRLPKRTQYSKSGLQFCTRKCKDQAQRLGSKFSQLRPAHYKTGKSSYRSKMGLALSDGCVECLESRRYLVCVTCHRRRHLRLKGGKWIFCNKSLTPREMLSLV
jgi:hypothetical protein